MWSNTKPDGGIIVIGIEDDGTLSGCIKTDQPHINEIELTRDVYCPDAKFESKHVTIKNSSGRVINFLAENKQISVSQVQRLTGKTWPSSSKLLKGLKSKGILDDIRKTKARDSSARYILKGDNKLIQ